MSTSTHIRGGSKAKVPALGQGVYTISEVSRYAGLPQQTARAWFKGRSDGSGRGPVFSSDYPPVGKDYAVSFLDLIDAVVTRRFRRAGVTLATIRRAYQLLKEDLATDHPFAHDQLFTDGRRVIVGAARRINQPLLYDAISRQQFFAELRDVLDRVDYQEQTHLARRWRIADGVVIDPNLSLGKPVVSQTATETWVVARQYQANHGNAAIVADLFEISEEDVEKAVRFEATYGKLAA